MKNLVERLIEVKPSPRQLEWHKLKFYAFICFGTNTFYDCEWGTGEEDPQVFNPTELDVNQWVEVVKSAGMKGVILTCKHHDGFCLWPSKYTEQSIKNSPYKQGQGDIVGELAEACRNAGIKFGVYLSPWDIHEQTYGTEAYNDYFINQLTELLTEYGEIFSVWFDGACGEGANGKKQVYDWDRYYSVIRELQPNAVISVSGPDVRWCGNEAGHCRESEWNVVSKRLSRPNYVQEHSQKKDGIDFREKPISAMDKDLGSRAVLTDEEELVWYPCEVDTSIRPGWYYHQREDDKVRSLEELINIYENSVGGNATLLLNVPPDKRGLIHETDAGRLKELGNYINSIFQEEVMCKIEEEKGKDGETIFYCTVQDIGDIQWVYLEEDIRYSQRIESFTLEIKQQDTWKEVYNGTTVGIGKLCRLKAIQAQVIKITIKQCRSNPILSKIGVYK